MAWTTQTDRNGFSQDVLTPDPTHRPICPRSRLQERPGEIPWACTCGIRRETEREWLDRVDREVEYAMDEQRALEDEHECADCEPDDDPGPGAVYLPHGMTWGEALGIDEGPAFYETPLGELIDAGPDCE